MNPLSPFAYNYFNINFSVRDFSYSHTLRSPEYWRSHFVPHLCSIIPIIKPSMRCPWNKLRTRYRAYITPLLSPVSVVSYSYPPLPSHQAIYWYYSITHSPPPRQISINFGVTSFLRSIVCSLLSRNLAIFYNFNSTSSCISASLPYLIIISPTYITHSDPNVPSIIIPKYLSYNPTHQHFLIHFIHYPAKQHLIETIHIILTTSLHLTRSPNLNGLFVYHPLSSP